ncbi:fluoride efflux transporter CrcB [Stackebrandtia nassauensis]|uniref:Fluoride-specific ion channel FluC n=1 Tax=Stackebrandtia nassauensis (strain DSM 44728 / CIP 108903 / NRRL B-16338 / NBRC 102104 / LLR-40K-21) TaxID=446470 RepID=D3PZ73_STANL|nr:fluoride efflux transporter CrcB [Stackebrandtia nassauensis]ADD45502.1 CrcB protein [Stackebrandtia nassauensis DSM 44728]
MRVTLAAVSAGGVIGALARFGLTQAFPARDDGFPWGIWFINVIGCLLIGVLMAWLSTKAAPNWVRPLLGVGVLGGFTTFSAYSVDAVRLVDAGRPLLALTYVLTTVLGALVAVFAGSRLTRRILSS